jgi:hypothetical protein
MTNNKQKTAVQEFWGKISLKLSFEQIDEFVPLFYQAKEMEKEKAIKLHYEYELYVMITESVVMTFGQFYEQTYGGGDK